MAKIKSNQDYYNDISSDNFKFLSLDNSTIIAPLDEWPEHSGKPWAASGLKMTTHFEVESTDSRLVPLIENFLSGIIAKALMSSDEKCIEVELLHITADVLESTLLLKHVREVNKGMYIYKGGWGVPAPLSFPLVHTFFYRINRS